MELPTLIAKSKPTRNERVIERTSCVKRNPFGQEPGFFHSLDPS